MTSRGLGAGAPKKDNSLSIVRMMMMIQCYYI